MVPVVLCDTRHSGLNLSAGETTFFRGVRQEKTLLWLRSSAARAALRSTRLLLHLFRANYSCRHSARSLGVQLASHRIQGLRRFIGKPQLNTIFAISTASLVWPQATAVLQTDLTKTA
ncbi:hypothetical protein CX682_06905 [Pseudomonas sp. FFUP_PS_41]|nr:hypothetical protein CX682_06905 [Pseudomonas sp. FFUP_PS_41]